MRIPVQILGHPDMARSPEVPALRNEGLLTGPGVVVLPSVSLVQRKLSLAGGGGTLAYLLDPWRSFHDPRVTAYIR